MAKWTRGKGKSICRCGAEMTFIEVNWEGEEIYQCPSCKKVERY